MLNKHAQERTPMPRTASTVTFGDFSDAVDVEALRTFWKAGANLSSDQKRKMREQVMGSNHTSIWNMVQDVENITKGGSNREAPVRMTGKLTVENVAAALNKYVRDGEPYPVPDGAPSAEQGAPSNGNASTASTPPSPAAASGEPPQGVSPNVLEALTALYEDQGRTFETVATGNDFRMLLWSIAPDALKASAEQGIIGDALGTLTKSADATATIRSILKAAGLTDEQVLTAMRDANPGMVTAQHSRAADSLFHLNLVKRQLDGYEGLIRDEAVAIVRKSRQRSEATEAQVNEARNTVAVDTLGDLLDSLEREAKRWQEWSDNRKAQREREQVAQGGTPVAEPEAIPYETLPEAVKAIMSETDWSDLPTSAQHKLAERWKDAPEPKAETEAEAVEAAAEAAEEQGAPPEEGTAEAAAEAAGAEAAPEGNGNQRRRR